MRFLSCSSDLNVILNIDPLELACLELSHDLMSLIEDGFLVAFLGLVKTELNLGKLTHLILLFCWLSASILILVLFSIGSVELSNNSLNILKHSLIVTSALYRNIVSKFAFFIKQLHHF